MLNLTLFSLNILSATLQFPLYTIANSQISQNTLIYKSYFSNNFHHFIYSNTKRHYTKLKNTKFSYTLKSAVKFVSDISSCSYSMGNDFIYNKNTKIRNLILTSNDFNNNELDQSSNFDHRPYFLCEDNISSLGNIYIITCIFDHCFSIYGNGGGICIEQDGIVFLHGSIFSYCYTSNNGAGVFAVRRYNSFVIHYSETSSSQAFNDSLLTKFTAQYCCFQNCFGYTFGNLTLSPNGLSIYTASMDTNIQYTSYVLNDFGYVPDQTRNYYLRGNVFLIQSGKTNLKTNNLTNGYDPVFLWWNSMPISFQIFHKK